MPFDEAAADRLRAALSTVLKQAPARSLEEKKMFGGLAIMVDGHMCVGIIENRVVARIGPDNYADAIGQEHVGPMDFTGRPMKGWLYLMPPVVQDAAALEHWVELARAFVAGLGPKKPRKQRTRRSRG